MRVYLITWTYSIHFHIINSTRKLNNRWSLQCIALSITVQCFRVTLGRLYHVRRIIPRKKSLVVAKERFLYIGEFTVTSLSRKNKQYKAKENICPLTDIYTLLFKGISFTIDLFSYSSRLHYISRELYDFLLYLSNNKW